MELELISCEKQTYLFFKISSYVVEASSYLYKKVWFLVTYLMKIHVFLEVMPYWPVNAVTLSEDIYTKFNKFGLLSRKIS